ncbi:MAG: D-lyxose/D-mannose family sugar isomerase [Ruminococcaceae bacterium]|nr:D-lyxose/D-mannose family sugar isomerase [Oscillospiraceae bacterium]
MKKSLYNEVKEKALEIYKKANIVLTQEEIDNLEIADFGLDDIYKTGLEIVTYVNTDRCCAKELAMLPNQTCPEHIHVPIENIGYIGKEETFRCRFGEVYLYVSGPKEKEPSVQHPEGKYTVFHEIKLLPGQQYTLAPNTLHWFQAGDEGAVVSEFSTSSYDECDVFTDERISRLPTIED